jgi:hypothetical protein
MGSPSKDCSPQHRTALESFPRIAEKVALLWKSRELEAFVNSLILDSRDGARQGFPMAVAHELMFLVETNRYVRAIEAAEKLKIKFSEAYKMVVAGDEAHLKASVWDDPLSGSENRKRESGRTSLNRQLSSAARGEQGDSFIFVVGRFVFSKWFIFVMFAALSVKAALPLIKNFFSLIV